MMFAHRNADCSFYNKEYIFSVFVGHGGSVLSLVPCVWKITGSNAT